MTKVLGIDPGVARLGYGVVEELNGKLICHDYGCITTRAGEAQAERLAHIFSAVENIIIRHKPQALALEELFYFKNQKTIIRVGEARGVVLAAAARAGLAIYPYTPLQIKQAVTGYGQAEKLQVQKMVQRLLALETMPASDDAADGLAVAICCLHGWNTRAHKTPSAPYEP